MAARCCCCAAYAWGRCGVCFGASFGSPIRPESGRSPGGLLGELLAG